MSGRGPVILLTDFGWDVYVGVMKGVILSICPTAQVIDLAHNIAPQNIREGAWLLLTNFRYFPEGSIFVAVVDPGVGSARKALAVATKGYYFIGPDNGLLYPAATRAGVAAIVELDVPEDASFTFHGRDVFAPAAARLAAGMPFSGLGKAGTFTVRLNFTPAGREGEVVYVDRFGNVVTNLPPLPGRRSYTVTAIGKEEVYFKSELPFFSAYADAPEDVLFLITGSGGTLELSVKNGAAAPRLGVRVADRMVIE
ncbi:MAG: SAM-dependent chlorinase/fluorinase [Bacillota bacterium]